MTSISNNYVCLDSFATFDVVLGFLLSGGILLSFLPQIIVLIVNKNVDGLSVLSCCFNYANCMCNFINILLLNWFVFDCCSTLSSWRCFENLLPVVQMFSPFVSTFVIFLLYTLYRPKEVSNVQVESLDSNESTPPRSPRSLENNENSDQNSSIQVSDEILYDSSSRLLSNENNSSNNSNVATEKSIKEDKDRAVINSATSHMNKGKNSVERFFIKMDWYSMPFFLVSLGLTIVFLAIGLAMAFKLGSRNESMHIYAFSLGILASILVFFQWLPQIYTTWISQEIGSLSVLSLCIQAPGALAVVFFQWKQNWSTWFPYLATAIQAFVLIGICAYFKIRDKRNANKYQSI
ncbi:hypothetical protein DLAC_11183 [Tieghemostelium lacteum]|uniref:Uncharacterized protein n=1 Tax=Tieghemostelium lacteum TaxID=361077 RepID=A0A151Z3D9_TIELA|nr:hypothetical protein DLAC_11183 [Tieghemostelium lacteum]|eukprot:KYQ88470.1 hypothetical protein DLAC_11183 [Tieghemostelium lacteum]